MILRWDDRAVDHRDLPLGRRDDARRQTVTLAVWRSRGEHAIKVVTEKMPA